jgi:adenylate cyclase
MRQRGSGDVVQLRPVAQREADAAAVALEPTESTLAADQHLFRSQARICTLALIAANTLGGLVVFGLSVFVVPGPQLHDQAAVDRTNLIAFATLGPVGLLLGFWLSLRLARKRAGWLCEGRAPTAAERTGSLRYAIDQARIEAGLWAVAAVVFSVLNARYSLTLGLEAAIEIVLGGLTTCALSYLILERFERPTIRRLLEWGLPERPSGPGVRSRVMLAWVFGSAVPLVGVALVGVADAAHLKPNHTPVGVAVAAVAAVGILVGIALMNITARSVADPLQSLRVAVAQLEDGQLETSVTVDDSSEVGMLQAGFNSMVQGLRERARLRDLFGRHVGEEVAREALGRAGTELGGETREAAVLFVDVIGSTTMANTREPEEVVAELNAFFAIVVDCVSLYGGWVNKFEGDAALCVFGAPTAHPDASGAALATARSLSGRLRRELHGVKAAIGVSAGRVVAGNVGAAERYEYTVIGDPVNEAARLSELAKSGSSRVLASAAALERAASREHARWEVWKTATLRGRHSPTTIVAPAGSIEDAPLKTA